MLITTALCNRFPPWRKQALRSLLKDVEAARSMRRASRNNDRAIEAIREAYRLADERLRGAR